MTDFLGEFFGTAVLILLGNGVVAGVLLGKSKAQNAGWIAITAGWAFAVMAGVYTARAVGSKGFVNPVGPVAGVATGSLPLDQALLSVGGELLGAFVGSVIVWLHYQPHWAETKNADAIRACFCTAPAIRSPLANFLSEMIGTFVLVLVGSAILEKDTGRGFVAPLGGALVWGIGLSLGGTTGYAINPARDLAPRLAHALLPIPGKGHSDWGYAWVPVLGPLVGGVAAALRAKHIMPG